MARLLKEFQQLAEFKFIISCMHNYNAIYT